MLQRGGSRYNGGNPPSGSTLWRDGDRHRQVFHRNALPWEPAQRTGSPMPNAQCPIPNAQCPIPNPQLTPQHLFHPNLAGKL